MEQRSQIFYSMGTHLGLRSAHVSSWVNGLRVQARQGAGAPQEFVALSHVLDDMRLYKSRAEQASLRRAAQIAVGAHRRAMRFARPGRMEYEVMAEMLHEFRSHNADISYHPIVGGGANACVMHYRDNDQRLCDGDLLLLDAGCEHDYYASDITRTFPGERPVHARRSARSTKWCWRRSSPPSTRCGRAITGIIRTRPRCAPSPRAWSSWGCSREGCATLIKDQAYLPFFNHRTGHWLGLDVHDVGDYKVGGEWRVLEPGMALTVEPGIYIRPVAAGAQGVLEHRRAHRG